MEWFTRMILDLPPRAKDVKELRESAPELFSNEKCKGITKHPRAFFHPLYWDAYELREAIRDWLQRFEEPVTDIPERDSCNHPYCLRKKGGFNVNNDMQLMTVAGGKGHNPPAKSFFNLIDATKIKKAIVQRVILTDPYIYSDIGQNGNGGGFDNLLKLLEHLNILSTSSFELKLTPQNDLQKIDRLEKRIQQKFTRCSVSNHSNTSTFHDRFIFVQYNSGEEKAWYGPSLNGLNSDSIIIFGDLTEADALMQLSQRLL